MTLANISIIITSYREQKTIKRAIACIAEHRIRDSEIIVVAPDKETLSEAEKLTTLYKNLIILKDRGEGKSSALNFAVSRSKGKILILTDGDVFVGKNSLKFLLENFKDNKIGAVSGNPVSLNKIDNKYGFWAYVLTNIANLRRKRAVAIKKRFFCSGYLFAIRRELFPLLPENLLSEDGYISHIVYQKGAKICYDERAKVYVTYPDNIKDWINQKRRSAGGYNQNYKILGVKIRSFSSESSGAFDFFRYVTNVRETAWLIGLFLTRLYLWFLIYRDINIRKKGRKDLWLRVESTK